MDFLVIEITSPAHTADRDHLSARVCDIHNLRVFLQLRCERLPVGEMIADFRRHYAGQQHLLVETHIMPQHVIVLKFDKQ